MTLEKNSIYSLSRKELAGFLKEKNFSEKLAIDLFRQFYKNNKRIQVVSEKVWSALYAQFNFDLPEIAKIDQSPDGTIKFLIRFKDNKTVETVLIPFHRKYSICLSSQVGCAMKCSFCYTGTMGLSRHLKADEIIAQYIVAKNYLEEKINPQAISPNIVFMGQGEPLHNSDEVLKAIEILSDKWGLAIGPRQMTLSTAGYLPGMKKLALFPKINIALSLHSPFNEVRKELIPINQHYPLEEIFKSLDQLELLKNQFITYEYLLIDSLNDREEDAIELERWLKNRKAIINIIPFNPFPGSQYARPSLEKINYFKKMLVERKLRAMIRTTKGSDILAACGQLKS